MHPHVRPRESEGSHGWKGYWGSRWRWRLRFERNDRSNSCWRCRSRSQRTVHLPIRKAVNRSVPYTREHLESPRYTCSVPIHQQMSRIGFQTQSKPKRNHVLRLGHRHGLIVIRRVNVERSIVTDRSKRIKRGSRSERIGYNGLGELPALKDRLLIDTHDGGDVQLLLSHHRNTGESQHQ